MSANSGFIRQAFLTLAISLLLVCTNARSSFAQLGVTVCTDSEANVTENDANTDEIVEELGNNAIQNTSEQTAISVALGVIDTDLNKTIALLSQGNNNSSAMSTSVLSKGVDAMNANIGYVGPMQATQATIMSDTGAGNGAYQYANLCQTATGMSGASTMENAQAMELCAYNSYRCQGSSMPLLSNTESLYQGLSTSGTYSIGGYAATGSPAGGGAGVIAAQFVKIDDTTRKGYIAAAASKFFGSSQLGSDKNILSTAKDQTTIATHLDIDPLSLSQQPTYSDTYQQAHDMLSIYLNGLPPPIDSSNASYTTNSDGTLTPEYSSQLINTNEKLAFQNLTSMAMAKERAYHDAVKSNVASAVSAIYKQANFADPAYNGYISPAALDDALYREPADDPNFAKNFTGQVPKVLLGYIATELLLLNKLEYKRYLQEMEMYKIQSASLNLQARTFPFNQHE